MIATADVGQEDAMCDLTRSSEDSETRESSDACRATTAARAFWQWGNDVVHTNCDPRPAIIILQHDHDAPCRLFCRRGSDASQDVL